MADRVVTVTSRNWFQRMFSSVIGVVLGILLFFGSFVLLWVNEGRVDLSRIMAQSAVASPAQVDPALQGEFVSLTGNIVAAEPLGDPEYLQPGPYIQLHRVVEMYAWEESCTSRTETTVGGGERTTRECTYEKGWTTSPEDASTFDAPSGHENPPMTVDAATFTVPTARLGPYTLDTQNMALPDGSDVTLSAAAVTNQQVALEGNYLFRGAGSMASPQVGDIRISYSALPNNAAVTAFGEQQGDRLLPYIHRTDDHFYSVHHGDRAAAIDEVATQHKVLTWVLRLGGFLMMWIGLSLILGPISTFFDVLPFLGRMTGMAIGLLTFGVALVLSLVTIIIALIFHNVWLMLLLALLILGTVWLVGQRRQVMGSEQPV